MLGSTSRQRSRSRRAYRSVRSTKLAPTRGEVAVRLMWSLMSTGVPGDHDGSSPPHPFVSTIARQPAAAAVRTACTTAPTPRPSYKWVRPRKTSRRRSPNRIERTVPPWPATAGAAKPGRSAVGSSAADSPSASAAGSQPDPMTRAMSWSAPVDSRSRSAAAFAVAYGSFRSSGAVTVGKPTVVWGASSNTPHTGVSSTAYRYADSVGTAFVRRTAEVAHPHCVPTGMKARQPHPSIAHRTDPYAFAQHTFAVEDPYGPACANALDARAYANPHDGALARRDSLGAEPRVHPRARLHDARRAYGAGLAGERVARVHEPYPVLADGEPGR